MVNAVVGGVAGVEIWMVRITTEIMVGLVVAKDLRDAVALAV